MEGGTGRAQNQESILDIQVPARRLDPKNWVDRIVRDSGCETVSPHSKTVTARAERANLMGRQVNVFPVEQEP